MKMERQMNILFIMGDHSYSNFGITSVLSQLVDELVNRNNNLNVSLATSCSDLAVANWFAFIRLEIAQLLR